MSLSINAHVVKEFFRESGQASNKASLKNLSINLFYGRDCGFIVSETFLSGGFDVRA
jgi:hypothetical protein